MEFTKDELKKLAAHYIRKEWKNDVVPLADEWLPYPENTPEERNYNITVRLPQKGGYKIYTSFGAFNDGRWMGWNNELIIAYRDLPEPYQQLEV